MLMGKMYFLPFLYGIISYWLMRYYFDLYSRFKGEEHKKLSLFFSAFLFFVIGLVFVGLNMGFLE